MPRLLRDIACWPKEVVDSVAIKMQQPGDSAWHANGYRYDLVWSDHGVVMRNGIIMFHILRKGLGATPDFRRSEEWHIDFEGKRYMWGVHTVCNNPVTLITLIPEIICPVCIIPPPEPKKEKCYEFYFPGTPGHSMVLNTYTRNGESFPATVCDGIRQGTGDVVKQPDCFDCVVGRDSVPSNWKPIYRRSYTMTNREQTLILPTSEVYVTFCEENASGIAVTRGYVLHRREWVISETERSFMALTEDKRYHVSARPGFNTPDDRGWDPTTTSGLPEEP
jgi:hypothetical protein